ncbi:MAG: hypothetical protein KZQ77_10895 [Candidatus Thiodiazotropha sp. (ex Notomyrtea botanica)]|nr:hypothetical protein [Candidatus Thiodiazotropha sp. (ex Notomyrtea botanica)]
MKAPEHIPMDGNTRNQVINILGESETTDRFIFFVECAVLTIPSDEEWKQEDPYYFKLKKDDPEYWDFEKIERHAAALINILNNLHGDAELRINPWVKNLPYLKSGLYQLYSAANNVLWTQTRKRGEKDTFALSNIAKAQWIIKLFKDSFPNHTISEKDGGILNQVISAIIGMPGSHERLIKKAMSE